MVPICSQIRLKLKAKVIADQPHSPFPHRGVQMRLGERIHLPEILLLPWSRLYTEEEYHWTDGGDSQGYNRKCYMTRKHTNKRTVTTLAELPMQMSNSGTCLANTQTNTPLFPQRAL